MGYFDQKAWNAQAAARFTVGRDHHGWWVVHDREGRVGGLFATEDAALHFAAGECNRQPGAICRASASDIVELGSFTSDRWSGRRAAAPRH